jgi:hypothetical protein
MTYTAMNSLHHYTYSVVSLQVRFELGVESSVTETEEVLVMLWMFNT